MGVARKIEECSKNAIVSADMGNGYLLKYWLSALGRHLDYAKDEKIALKPAVLRKADRALALESPAE